MSLSLPSIDEAFAGLVKKFNEYRDKSYNEATNYLILIVKKMDDDIMLNFIEYIRKVTPKIDKSKLKTPEMELDIGLLFTCIVMIGNTKLADEILRRKIYTFTPAAIGSVVAYLHGVLNTEDAEKKTLREIAAWLVERRFVDWHHLPKNARILGKKNKK